MTLSTTLSRPARIGAIVPGRGRTAVPPRPCGHRARLASPAVQLDQHNISDLGNVHCGVWDTTRPRYVCSPWHPLMHLHVLGALLILVLGNIGLPLASASSCSSGPTPRLVPLS